jgi:hypothetical protein
VRALTTARGCASSRTEDSSAVASVLRALMALACSIGGRQTDKRGNRRRQAQARRARTGGSTVPTAGSGLRCRAGRERAEGRHRIDVGGGRTCRRARSRCLRGLTAPARRGRVARSSGCSFPLRHARAARAAHSLTVVPANAMNQMQRAAIATHAEMTMTTSSIRTGLACWVSVRPRRQTGATRPPASSWPRRRS